MKAAALAGAIAACFSTVAFLTLHAIVIVPIWRQGVGELPFAIVCGAIIGGSLHWFARRPLAIGVFLWGSLVTATIVFHLGPRLPEWVEIAIALAVAVVYGASVGWFLHRTRAAAIAAGIASVVMLAVCGGPVIRTSGPALMICLAVLPAACVYAMAYAGSLCAIRARFRGSAPLSRPA